VQHEDFPDPSTTLA